MDTQRSKSYLLSNSNDFEQEKNRLKTQAKFLQKYEWPIITKQIDFQNQMIIDLGCGTGDYLACLKDLYGVQDCVGLDRNKMLIDIAKNRYPNISFETSDIVKEIGNISNKIINKDFSFLSRFVFQHMSISEISLLLTNLKNNYPKKTITVIDAIHDLASFKPNSEKLKKSYDMLYQYQFSNGGDRNIGNFLETIFTNHNLSNIRGDVIFIDNNTISRDIFAEIFCPVIMNGLKLITNESQKEEYRNEIENWFQSSIKNISYQASFAIKIVSAIL